jgi:hypothetical protein
MKWTWQVHNIAFVRWEDAKHPLRNIVKASMHHIAHGSRIVLQKGLIGLSVYVG